MLTCWIEVPVKPVTGSETKTVMLSEPTIVLVSLKVAKAVFNVVNVPLSVSVLLPAPVTVSPVAALTDKRPCASLN